VRSDDTDLLILLLGHSTAFDISSDIFLIFGEGGNTHKVDIRGMAAAMGERLANTMIGFHAFTGCDTTSAFYGKGKVRPFEIMLKSERIRCAISQLGEEWNVPDQVTVDLEEFVCQI
jgi:hypothetical protein